MWKWLPTSLVARLSLIAVLLTAVSIPLFLSLFSAAVKEISTEVVDTRIIEFARQVRGFWVSNEAFNLVDELGEESQSTASLAGADADWVWQVSIDGAVVAQSELLALTNRTLWVDPSLVAEREFALVNVDSALGALRLAVRRAQEVPPFANADANPLEVVYMAGVVGTRYDAYVEDHAARLEDLALIGVVPVSLAIFAMLAFIVLAIRRDLSHLTKAMDSYERGEVGHISGAFPGELARIVDRMNGLLTQNAKLVARTRKYVSKIAHDINHPLAVMKNGLKDDADTALLSRQVDRMAGLVDRYSSLARAIGPEGKGAQAIDILPLLEDVAEGFSILYRRAPLEIRCVCDADVRFAIPKHDLEAMLSNLVSNAHKYAETEVVISAVREQSGLRVRVEDDGPGIPDDQFEAALNWGKRLDEAPPGTGFGLSIVQDIADLYEGELTLKRSATLAGLHVEIFLPERALS